MRTYSFTEYLCVLGVARPFGVTGETMSHNAAQDQNHTGRKSPMEHQDLPSVRSGGRNLIGLGHPGDSWRTEAESKDGSQFSVMRALDHKRNHG